MDDLTRNGWVYRSDSSWAAHGNRSGRRYHWPNPTDPARGACSRFVLDDQHNGQPAAEVPAHMRCQRRACATQYQQHEHHERQENHALPGTSILDETHTSVALTAGPPCDFHAADAGEAVEATVDGKTTSGP